jgi:hypothetical protein
MYSKKNVTESNLNATKQITHIVLNTGKMCEIPPGEFISEAMLLFRQLVKSGGGPVPAMEGIEVVIERQPGRAILVFRNSNRLPLLGIVAGFAEPGAADIWEFIKRQYSVTGDCDLSRLVFGDSEYPEMPSSLPWLASYIFPPGYDWQVNYPELIKSMAWIGQGLVAAIIALDHSCQMN